MLSKGQCVGICSCFVTIFLGQNFAKLCQYMLDRCSRVFRLKSISYFQWSGTNQLQYKIDLTKSDALYNWHQISASSGCTAHTVYNKIGQPIRFTGFWVYDNGMHFSRDLSIFIVHRYSPLTLLSVRSVKSLPDLKSCWGFLQVWNCRPHTWVHAQHVSILPAHGIHLLLQPKCPHPNWAIYWRGDIIYICLRGAIG